MPDENLPILIFALAVGRLVTHAADWLTSGGAPQRTCWLEPAVAARFNEAAASADTDDDDSKAEFGAPLRKGNVKKLRLLWKIKLNNEPQALNSIQAPLIVERIITDRGFKELLNVSGISDNVFVVDADLGTPFWQRYFTSTAASGAPCRPRDLREGSQRRP